MRNVLPRKGSTYRKVKGKAGGGFELGAGAAFDFDDELPMENCQRTSRMTAGAEATADEHAFESAIATWMLKLRMP